ncbi:hypothetical protein [Mesobacillus maritimus]|uniref:DUF4321 domain-containing protein n=1 Tax=Mesobacillus maritimus TaxID=1643336 RepID=A0ABS7K3N5_9BACI|nr:hypothetical protein [Mesobacillus maritimus]MBY0096766.1 hypothetical protein [Mesobacillus maritimus]
MKWFFVALLSLFGFLFLEKGIELWTVMDQVDAKGIAINFLGIEISETVLKDKIPSFAFGFTVAASIPIVVAINLAIKSTIIKEKNRTIV